MPVFSDFMHPNRLCKCCHPILHPKHPSTKCSCCIVAWEKTDRAETLEAFISVKISSAPVLAAKPGPKKQEFRPEFNAVICNSAHTKDMEQILFGTEEIVSFPEATSLVEILVKFGVFPSRGQAKKNGWDREILPGVSEFQIGKLRTSVTVWLPVEFAETVESA